MCSLDTGGWKVWILDGVFPKKVALRIIGALLMHRVGYIRHLCTISVYHKRGSRYLTTISEIIDPPMASWKREESHLPRIVESLWAACYIHRWRDWPTRWAPRGLKIAREVQYLPSKMIYHFTGLNHFSTKIYHFTGLSFYQDNLLWFHFLVYHFTGLSFFSKFGFIILLVYHFTINLSLSFYRFIFVVLVLLS